jgi:membrane dipeptidase
MRPICFIVAAWLLGVFPLQADEPMVSETAWKIHHAGLLFDGHNDLPWQVWQIGESSFEKMDIALPQPKLHTDIPRLRTGGLKAQFWSDATGDALLKTLGQIDLARKMVKKYPDVFEMAATAEDVARITKQGKIASMLGVEGGHCIANSLQNLQRFYDLGVRYMTLTHSKSLGWADSATDMPQTNGLSPFGEEVIKEMNRLGMLVDLSHVSPATMKAALKVSQAPVIFSHSSARAICDHPRNVPDDVLRELPKNGGVVMINFYSGFIVPTEELKQKPKSRGTLEQVVDHIEHVIQVAGIDHVGIGSDYDGINSTPVGLEDVSRYPAITQELLNRGYDQKAIHKILGGNVMRVLRQAEQTAKKLKSKPTQE